MWWRYWGRDCKAKLCIVHVDMHWAANIQCFTQCCTNKSVRRHHLLILYISCAINVQSYAET